MGKVFLNKECDECGIFAKVIETFGRKYCYTCWEKRPKTGKGHSGMTKTGFTFSLPFGKGLELEKVPKSNDVFSSLYLSHYPGSLGIVGRQCNYIVKLDGAIAGIIGANSPPLNYKKFVNHFKGYNELNYLNNNVFCMINHSKNLGTQVLKLFRKTVKQDYEKFYYDKLVGLVTFVEPPRNGAVYKADNWVYLGETEGKSCKRRGDHGKWVNKEWTEGSKKLVFVKWLS